MNSKKWKEALVLASIVAGFTTFVGIMMLSVSSDTHKDVVAVKYIQSIGCKRTGFVGKDAESVYTCAGNLYKYRELRAIANRR
jgi:hypothetical protein